MSATKPHWRRPEDTAEIGYVGDRIVAICQWSEQHDRVVKRHVITLTIHEDSIRDNEDQGYCLHDCDAWMPEAEFLRLCGPEVQADTPPDAAPWQGQDGWEGKT